MMDASEFRRVMGHFPTGVAIVTTRTGDGEVCGLTVNAFTSVSLDPTLVLVCIERDADSHECIRASGVFAVNVLEGEEGETISRRFASLAQGEKFAGIPYHEERTGSPVLDMAMAWLDCTVVQAVPSGDHTVFIGRAVAGDAREGSPLLYYRGGYATVQR